MHTSSVHILDNAASPSFRPTVGLTSETLVSKVKKLKQSQRDACLLLVVGLSIFRLKNWRTEPNSCYRRGGGGWKTYACGQTLDTTRTQKMTQSCSDLLHLLPAEAPGQSPHFQPATTSWTSAAYRRCEQESSVNSLTKRAAVLVQADIWSLVYMPTFLDKVQIIDLQFCNPLILCFLSSSSDW